MGGWLFGRRLISIILTMMIQRTLIINNKLILIYGVGNIVLIYVKIKNNLQLVPVSSNLIIHNAIDYL